MSNVITPEMQEVIYQKVAMDKSSYEFMRNHVHDYAPNPQNSAILAKYLEDEGLPWCTASLEQAFRDRKDDLTPVHNPNATITPTPKSAEELVATTPWPPFSTVQGIRDMSPKIYREFYYSAKHGLAFRAAVNEVLARGI
jgi:hypothetical protein